MMSSQWRAHSRRWWWVVLQDRPGKGGDGQKARIKASGSGLQAGAALQVTSMPHQRDDRHPCLVSCPPASHLFGAGLQHVEEDMDEAGMEDEARGKVKQTNKTLQ